MEDARARHKDVEIVLADHIGVDHRLADIICDRARAAEMRTHSYRGRPVLILGGLVKQTLRLSYADLRSSPDQVEDVGRLVPGRKGSGLRVGGLLQRAVPDPSAKRVVFHSADEGMRVDVSTELAADRAILIYRLGEDPLPETAGGPVRLVIPETEDGCNNLKRVSRLEVQA